MTNRISAYTTKNRKKDSFWNTSMNFTSIARVKYILIFVAEWIYQFDYSGFEKDNILKGINKILFSGFKFYSYVQV